jgi:tetratricopeptide (TPR) repeat protein
MAKVRAGQFSNARDQLEQARLIAHDPDLVARIDLSLAYVDAETGAVDSGLARCESLVADEALSAFTHGLAWAQLALIRQRTGHVDQALEAFSTAIPLLGDEPQEAGRALLNRGSLHLRRGNPQAAIVDLAEADREFGRVGLTVQRAKAEHNLGFARLLTGDVVGALQTMESARSVLAPLSVVSRAVGEQDRAEALTAAGRAGDAIKALESAAAAYGSRRLRSFQAQCELTLAWSLLREDPVRARVVARRAARHFRSQASPVLATRAEAVEVVAEVGMGRRGPSLVRRADSIVKALRRHGHQREAAIVALQAARVSVRRGLLDDARERIDKVRVTEDSPVATRLLWREVRSELAQARGDRRHARRHVRAGLADLHAWQSSFGSLDLQSTLVGHGRALALQGLRLALAEGSPALAYEWSERARALVARVTPVRPPADEQQAGLLTELRVLYAADPSPRSADGRRLDQLRDRIREQSWYGDGSGQVGEPAALEEVQAELAATDACLVAHVAVDGWITAIVVTGSAAHTVRLCESKPVGEDLDRIAADLDMAASQLAGPFAAAIRGSLDERLQVVSDLLVAPVLPLVGDRRVVLTPSGQLAGTPWTLLPGLAGRPVTVPPSATRWLELRRSGEHRRPRVGMVAGPHVERAEEEVMRASAAWPRATVLTGERAVATQVADLAAKVDVLHLAGHGRHPGDNPLFSAVELADGPWFGYDIDQLPHTPATVVLSSCELGRASVRSGDEVVGMTAA